VRNKQPILIAPSELYNSEVTCSR